MRPHVLAKGAVRLTKLKQEDSPTYVSAVRAANICRDRTSPRLNVPIRLVGMMFFHAEHDEKWENYVLPAVLSSRPNHRTAATSCEVVSEVISGSLVKLETAYAKTNLTRSGFRLGIFCR